jgi:hypothetical protein
MTSFPKRPADGLFGKLVIFKGFLGDTRHCHIGKKGQKKREKGRNF